MNGDADAAFMRLALEVSAGGRFISHPNPSVGCVIVKDGVVVARGCTQRAGGPHAEISALRDADARGISVEGADVYVTLEPCSHYGRTPPCATELARRRVARVVAAMEDPNPLVAGRGMAILREAGISTRVGVLREEAWESNRGFFTRMTNGVPWVVLKVGASIDGRTALSNGESKWITCGEAREDVQRLRASSGAVMTGVGTVIADDCRLNVRIPAPDGGPARQPLRVVADSRLNTPAGASVLLPGGGTLVACAEGSPAREEVLREAGADVVRLPGPDGRVDLAALMRELGAREVNSVLVEAGSRLSGAMLSAGLVDEIVVYLAPLLMGEGRSAWRLGPYESLAQAEKWSYRSVSRVGTDIRVVMRKN